MQLSILDFFSDPRRAIESGTQAESLGYSRFWVGEHHWPNQIANPLMVVALVAGHTQRIRVGTGAVSIMLRNPRLVAEDARLTAYLFENRLDLGVAPALAIATEVRDEILDGRALDMSSYPTRLRRLQANLSPQSPETSLPYLAAKLPQPPPLWVLGRSARSAELAAELGAGFCASFHHGSTRPEITDAIAHYRDAFRASDGFANPRAIVVIGGIANGSIARAHRVINIVDARVSAEGHSASTLRFVGTPESCCDQIRAAVESVGADEAMILSLATGEDLAMNSEMYCGMAEAWGLEADRS